MPRSWPNYAPGQLPGEDSARQREVHSTAPGGSAASVAVDIDRVDPYFLWACQTRSAQVESIKRRIKDTQPSKSASKARRTKYYLQLLLDVQTAEQRAALEQAHSESRGGLYLREAYMDAGAGGQAPGTLAPWARFVTALVTDWWLEEFLKRHERLCAAWQMSHARNPRHNDPPLGPNPPMRALTHGWQHDHRLEGDVMVVIDIGCPFAHPMLRNGKGGTRVRYLWLQSVGALEPTHAHAFQRPLRMGATRPIFPYGHELRGSDLDRLMVKHTQAGVCDEEAVYGEVGYHRMRASDSHGAHVLSLACGHPNPLARDHSEAWWAGQGGAVPEGPDAFDRAGRSQVIFIELPSVSVGDTSGGSMAAHLLDALVYVRDRVSDTARVAVNCSFGTHAGPHDGSSMVERMLHWAQNSLLPASGLAQQPSDPRLALVVPMGNAFDRACFARADLADGTEQALPFDMPADKPTNTFIEVWLPAAPKRTADVPGWPLDEFEALSVTLTTPDGAALDANGARLLNWSMPGGGTGPSVTVVRRAWATDTKHLILIAIAPTREPDDLRKLCWAPYGQWVLRLKPASTHVAPRCVECRIERDDPIFEPAAEWQTVFVTAHGDDPEADYPDAHVTRRDTRTGLASAIGVCSVGGHVPLHGTGAVAVAAYSSAGPDAEDGPTLSAAVSDSLALPGRLGCGHRGNTWLRKGGTSIAAPQAARAWLNAGVMLAQAPVAPGLPPAGICDPGAPFPVDRDTGDLRKARSPRKGHLPW